MLNELFDVLNLAPERRQKRLDEDLAAFPFINGDLFAERLPTAAFDGAMRALLLEACGFKWDAISPAIFGSLFQSVMNARERRASGAHYTTEKNILKVIEPLFLDDLRAEFAKLKTRRDTGRVNALKAFHDRLAGLKFFDPACGCGNFLIIAYRELRALEIELLKEIVPKDQRVPDQQFEPFACAATGIGSSAQQTADCQKRMSTPLAPTRPPIQSPAHPHDECAVTL